MSIDAVISSVVLVRPKDPCSHCSGLGSDPAGTHDDDCPVCHGATFDRPVLRLHLEPREKGGLAGQKTLTVVNNALLPIDVARSWIGKQIWGNSSDLYCGDRKFARRVSYTRIEVVDQ